MKSSSLRIMTSGSSPGLSSSQCGRGYEVYYFWAIAGDQRLYGAWRKIPNTFGSSTARNY